VTRPHPVDAVLRAAAVLAVATAVAGCSWMPWHKKTPEEVAPPPDMQMLAVLPLEAASAPAGDDKGAPPSDDAGRAVTAQVYRVLADQTEFRFVADLAVSDVLNTPAVRRGGDVVERAVALGKEVGADGVIFGRVFRFNKRVGTEYGASEPASVSFELGLVSVKTGQVVWKGDYDDTQRLKGNFLNWWMFWSRGPRWVSASELAGTGVDKLFEDMTETVNSEG
jgi:hypothetical protein